MGQTTNCIPDKSDLRQSNFELLRIIAMLMIIASHFSYHGQFDFSENWRYFNKLLMLSFPIGGNLGVDLFVLISGYFLICSGKCKTEKVLRLWLQVLFYSIVLYAVFVLLGMEPFSVGGLVSSCFPLVSGQWWFASTYFVFYLISPYITQLLTAMDRKTYRRFLLVLLVCWCIVPTFSGQWFESNYLWWFVCLYACAGYYRLYGSENRMKAVTCFLLAAAGVFLTFSTIVLLDMLSWRIPALADYTGFFAGMNRAPNLFSAMMLMMGFSKVDIGYRRWINLISSAVFGVYLIHDNVYVRPFLWQKLFRNAAYAGNPALVFYALLVIAGVFAVCTVIELTRIHLLEKPGMGMIRQAADWIDGITEKILGKN